MKKVSAIPLAVAAWLTVLGGVADAASTLFSVRFEDRGGGIDCSIINVSAVTQTLQVQFIDSNGNVVGDSTPLQVTPGGVLSVGPGTLAAYCKFIASGAASDVRAAAYSYSSTGDMVLVFPAH